MFMFNRRLATRGRSRRRWVWGCGGVVGFVLVLAVAGLIVILWLITAEPAGWAENRRMLDERSQAELDRQAQAVENRLASEVTSVRRPGTSSPPRRTIRVGLEEANAWLDRRLHQWAQSQQIDLPEALQRMMLDTQDGQFVLRGKIHTSGFEQIISLRAGITVESEGPMRIRLNSIHAGRLPLPFDTAFQRSGLNKTLPAEAQQFLREAAGEGAELDSLWPIDQRQVRVLNVEPEVDAVAVTIRTESR